MKKDSLLSIKINDHEIKVAVVSDDASMRKGLSGLKSLGKNKGMLFMFPSSVRMEMVMRDMNFDLDFVFLDRDWTVVDTGTLAKDDEGGISPSSPVPMVLELPQGSLERFSIQSGAVLKPDAELEKLTSAIKKYRSGGKFEMIGEKEYDVKEDSIKVEEDMFQVLNNEGVVIANIGPGSRIFSREHTKELIKKYKQGDKLALADLMLHILDAQDKQQPDYVQK